MFLHLGCDVMVAKKELLGIFAYEYKEMSSVTKEFLDLARTEKKVVEISEPEKTKSFVLTDRKLYFSPISSITLQKRANLSFSHSIA